MKISAVAFPCMMLITALAGETSYAKKKLSCDDLSSARTAYEKGDVDGAVATLKKIRQKCPNSADAARLLSDIFWWSGSLNQSYLAAQEGLALLNPELSPFEDTHLHLSDRLSPFLLRASFAQFSANQNSGQDYALAGDLRIAGKQHLLMGADRTSRVYTGGTVLNDTRLSVAHVLPIGSTFYIENAVEYSPLAQVFAKAAVATTQHWITSGGTDLFLSARFAHYTTSVSNAQNIVSLSPGLNRAIGEHFNLGIQENLVRSYHWLNATQASLTYQPSNRLSFTASEAFGHVIEGPGLEGSFNVTHIGVKYRLTQTLALVPSEEIYRGSVRNETATALSAEVRFP